jgi:hypothetical protein
MGDLPFLNFKKNFHAILKLIYFHEWPTHVEI